MSDHALIVAVDIGNSRIKIGMFAGTNEATKLPHPARVLELSATDFDPASLDAWIASFNGGYEAVQWWIASVNGPPTEQLVAWLRDRGVRELGAAETDSARTRSGYCSLRHTDLPLAIDLAERDKVGIDRLLGAVAANHLRQPARPAIIIDLGSAITVDVVSASGAFQGGAILPGIGMSARALHDFTDRLPKIAMEELAEPPPALGTSTLHALRAGLYWGAVGAMKELIAQLTSALPRGSASPQIFLTGGAAPVVARFVDPGAEYVPHLILGGIALVART